MNNFNQYQVYARDIQEDPYLQVLHSVCGEDINSSTAVDYEMLTVEDLIKLITEHRENCGKTSS